MNKIFEDMDSAINRFFVATDSLSCVEQSPCIPCFTGQNKCDDADLLGRCMGVIKKAADVSLNPELLFDLNKAFSELSRIRGINDEQGR